MFKKLFFLFLVGASLAFTAETIFQKGNTLKFLARVSKVSDAEITAYMPSSKMLFAVGGNKTITVIDLENPKKLIVRQVVAVPGDASSVTVFNDLVAVSLIADPHTQNGQVHLYQYTDSLRLVNSYSVCAEPDMLTFSPKGKYVLVACEGSPAEDDSVDPEGAIALIDISKEPDNGAVSILTFNHLDSTALLQKGVRKSGPGSFFQNLEPEYITVEPSGQKAWVSLQENNAIAVIDIAAKKITSVFPLGAVDHSLPGQGFDFRKDKKAQIENAPVMGLRQPDGIAVYSQNGKNFLFTANEGASRKSPVFTDETNILKLFEKGSLNTDIFTASWLTALQKLTLSNSESCDAFPDRQCTSVYTFGSRSMSVFDGNTGALLFDSGDQIERTIAEIAPLYFNWNSKKKKVEVDARSLEKGSEPETVTIGEVNGRPLAFLGLERVSGIMVWDLENPQKPTIIDYYLDAKDRGPEGVLFISAENSPISGVPLLIVGHEYSNTIVIYAIQ